MISVSWNKYSIMWGSEPCSELRVHILRAEPWLATLSGGKLKFDRTSFAQKPRLPIDACFPSYWKKMCKIQFSKILLNFSNVFNIDILREMLHSTNFMCFYFKLGTFESLMFSYLMFSYFIGTKYPTPVS